MEPGQVCSACSVPPRAGDSGKLPASPPRAATRALAGRGNQPLAEPTKRRAEPALPPHPVGCAMGTGVCPGDRGVPRVPLARPGPSWPLVPPGLAKWLHGHLLAKSILCDAPAASSSWRLQGGEAQPAPPRKSPGGKVGVAAGDVRALLSQPVACSPSVSGEQLPSGTGAAPFSSLEPGWESGSHHALAKQTGSDRQRTGSPAPSCWDTG